MHRILSPLIVLVLALAGALVMPELAYGGASVTLAVPSVVGTRGASSPALTAYDNSGRQFQFSSMSAADTVRVDESNDGSHWTPLFTATGAQTLPVARTDRGVYYSAVRVAGTTSVGLVVSLGNDPNAAPAEPIQWQVTTAISATFATCRPMFTALGHDYVLTNVWWVGDTTLATDATNYDDVTFYLYDDSGVVVAPIGAWTTNKTADVTAMLVTSIPLTNGSQLIPQSFSVCWTATKHGTGSLPVGVFSFTRSQ